MQTNSVNTTKLFKHSYEIMMGLKAKQIEVKEAEAHANLLRQSNNLLKYELDRAIAIQKFNEIKIRDIEDIQIFPNSEDLKKSKDHPYNS